MSSTFQLISGNELVAINEKIFEQVIALDKKGLAYSWSRDSWKSSLKNAKNYTLFLATDLNYLSGFALYHTLLGDNQAHLLKFVVNDEYRGNGLAVSLFEYSKKELYKIGFEQIYLEVSKNNLRAINFYKKMNFQKIDEIKSFYSNGEDAIAFFSKCFV